MGPCLAAIDVAIVVVARTASVLAVKRAPERIKKLDGSHGWKISIPKSKLLQIFTVLLVKSCTFL